MKHFLPLAALLLAGPSHAWFNNCDYEKDIDLTADFSQSTSIRIEARAGDLVVKGISGDTAVIKGSVCASKEAYREAAQIEVREGEHAEIVVVLEPNSNTLMDLEISLPDHLAVKVLDSSGDIEVTGVASLSMQDSSGDIEIRDIAGDVTIEGDSSGDIEGKGIGGSVLVMKDSSGDIRFGDVTHDFVVEVDSSGDITADKVGGDFRVLKDGSGSVTAIEVAGEVES